MPTPTGPPGRSRWFGPIESGNHNHAADADAGQAILEVVFLAVLMLIPIIYLLISLVRIQAATLAVTQAARDAGRAVDAAPTIGDGIARARDIASIDLADQNIAAGTLTLQFVAPGATCSADNALTPTLDPGATYDVCVTAILTLPGIPTIVTGTNNTATGVYTIHISALREGN